MHHCADDDQAFQTLNILDKYTREYLLIRVGRNDVIP